MKRTSQVILMNYEHDVTVGDLSATLVAQICVSDNKPVDPEIEFADIVNIKFRGVEIDGYANWKLFKKFHMDMGIDYEKILDTEFERVFTKEAICRELGHGC